MHLPITHLLLFLLTSLSIMAFPTCYILFLYILFFWCLKPPLPPLPLSVSLAGWPSRELGLTFQLHFDLWPCCCRLLHLGHNSTCHSPTFHPLCSASHPPITILPQLPHPSFVSHIPELCGLFQERTHSTFGGEWWKEGETERSLYSQIKF